MRPLARLWAAYALLEWQAHVVVAVAVLAMAYVQLALPFHWGGGDPLDYYRMARLFLHLPGGLYVPWRPPGMAVFHILTGVAWLDTFKIFFAAHAAMSAAIPVLIYVTLRRYSATWAMVAALIATFGAVPYPYARTGLSDELFLFLHFCVLALVAAYFARPDNPRLPYAICLAMAALASVRPVAALYYWIFVLCAVVLVSRPLRHVLLATVVYAGLMGGWALADRYYGQSVFPTVYMPETAAQRLFGELYFSGGQYHFVPEQPPVAMIKRGDGPASARMYEALRWLARTAPDVWQKPNAEHPTLLFARFVGHEEELVQAVVQKPNFAYFQFLRYALQAKYGAKDSEALMYRIAAEHHNTGIGGVARYFAHHPTKLLVGSMPSTSGRYLLTTFYFTRLRKEVNLFHSVISGSVDVDRRLIDEYVLNPTPERSDRIHKGTGVRGEDLLNPANGPASKEFFRAVDFFARAYPIYWENTNAFFSRYKGNPDGLVRAVFDPKNPLPIGVYEGFYWESLIKYYGIGPADHLFSRVAGETMKAYPISVTMFLDNVLNITLIRRMGDIKGRGLSHVLSAVAGDFLYPVKRNDLSGLSPGLKRELKEELIYSDKYSNVVGSAYAMMHLLVPVFAVVALMLLPFCLLGPACRLAVFLVVGYVYNVAVIAISGFSTDPRFANVFVLLPVMLACLGAHFAILTFKQRAKLSLSEELASAPQDR